MRSVFYHDIESMAVRFAVQVIDKALIGTIFAQGDSSWRAISYILDSDSFSLTRARHPFWENPWMTQASWMDPLAGAHER